MDELLIAASGSFDITVDDGTDHRTFFLNRSYYGLYIPRMLWREINNFSSGSVCLVLASDYYDPDDYHRSYNRLPRRHGRIVVQGLHSLSGCGLSFLDE